MLVLLLRYSSSSTAAADRPGPPDRDTESFPDRFDIKRGCMLRKLLEAASTSGLSWRSRMEVVCCRFDHVSMNVVLSSSSSAKMELRNSARMPSRGKSLGSTPKGSAIRRAFEVGGEGESGRGHQDILVRLHFGPDTKVVSGAPELTTQTVGNLLGYLLLARQGRKQLSNCKMLRRSMCGDGSNDLMQLTQLQ